MHSATPDQHQRGLARLAPRQRGVAAVLAMMFLVIFGSLAAAMAIVSQGNLRTADSQMKINRSMATAETGMNLMIYRLEQVTQGDTTDPDTYPGVKTTAGLIHAGNSDDADGNTYELWATVADELATVMQSDLHFVDSTPYTDTELGKDAFNRDIIRLNIPAARLAPDGPVFSVTMIPHPLPLSEQPSNLGYDDPFYDRPPYDGSDPTTGIDFVVGETDPVPTDDTVIQPLDGRFIRVKVTAYDGDLDADDAAAKGRVYRSISMDFRLDKTIPYAILSRSRVMIGRNVKIKGNIGSRFMEVDKENGHPLQVQSDFLGLSDDLDDIIGPPPYGDGGNGGNFHNELVLSDIDGDNRLNLSNPTEIANIGEVLANSYDIDGDGYLTDFDFFLSEFDTTGNDSRVSLGEMTDNANDATTGAQLFSLMDVNGDGFVDADDLYSKIDGRISLLATADDWEDGLSSWGASNSNYKDYLQGSVTPDYGDAALTMGDPALEVHEFEASSFDTSSFADRTVSTVEDQKGIDYNGSATETTVFEEVPYGAAYPYDYYDRPVYKNMVFEDVFIPKGTNALFENCRFIGVTFVEIEPNNDDENFNYVGMQESDGSQKHPDYTATINGTDVSDTKPYGNNIRFHDCRFEGAVVSGDSTGHQPTQYTHVRNKIAFTGTTDFDLDAVTDEDDRKLYARSALLLPHISVEMGSFTSPADAGETLELSGAIVAGLLDMRGQVNVSGTIITTFEPVSGVAPVKGDTSPQFNTTLGYFSEGEGDLEAALPASGLGKITVTYDPTLALPDGIDGPIEMTPIIATYSEGGK